MIWDSKNHFSINHYYFKINIPKFTQIPNVISFKNTILRSCPAPSISHHLYHIFSTPCKTRDERTHFLNEKRCSSNMRMYLKRRGKNKFGFDGLGRSSFSLFFIFFLFLFFCLRCLLRDFTTGGSRKKRGVSAQF